MLEAGDVPPPLPLQVLIVEDDPDLRSTLTEVLTEEGYGVVAVSSGSDAIARAAEQAFDLIVTDIKMPGTDGLTALETVKQGNPEMAGIVITGYSTEDSALRAARMKVENYLKKPFHIDEFLAAVDRLAERKRLLQTRLAQELSTQQSLRWLSAELLSARVGREGIEVNRFLSTVIAAALPEYRDPREKTGAETALLWTALDGEGLSLPEHLWAALPERLSRLLTPLEETPLRQRLRELARALAAEESPDGQAETATDPEDFELGGSLLNMALLLESAGRAVEARTAFLSVLEKTQDASKTYPAQVGLARLARQSRDYPELESRLADAAEVARALGPLAHAEALTERGLLLSLAGRSGARQALTEAQDAAKRIKETTSFALSTLALDHFHGVTAPKRARLLAYLHLPENFTATLQAAGWLLEYLLASSLEDEERRFLHKLLRSSPKSFHLLVLNTTEPEVAVRILECLHLAPTATQALALERFAAMESAEVRRAVSRWQGQAQAQVRQGSLLRIYSFSGMQLYRDDEALDMKRKKPLLLLLYLVYRNAPVGEEALLEIFWPGDEERSRASLRTALSYLRKLLAPDSPVDPFERQAAGICLAKGVQVWFDHREFESLVGQGQAYQTSNPQRAVECYRAAVKLYRGPFLENIYEDWTLEAREQAEKSLADCLRYLTEQCLSAGSWAEAYEHASRALRHDDLSQPFYEMGMRALMQMDRHHEALQLFEQGKSRLQRELDLEPSIEMIRLRETARLNV